MKEIRERDVYIDMLTGYTNLLRERSDKSKLVELEVMRGFSRSVLDESGIFYIDDHAEMLMPEYLDKVKELGVISETNLKPIFKKRYVIPIKDRDGRVLGLVGYTKEAKERYVYGTSKYYDRRNTLWGLENLGLAYEKGYAILVEGITDAIRLRDMGYKNVFAACGTNKSEFKVKQLNRCRYGVILIPDRDKPGLGALEGWRSDRNLILKVPIIYKDVDEMCSVSSENRDWFNDYMKDCEKWIQNWEHNGIKSVSEEVTIL